MKCCPPSITSSDCFQKSSDCLHPKWFAVALLVSSVVLLSLAAIGGFGFFASGNVFSQFIGSTGCLAVFLSGAALGTISGISALVMLAKALVKFRNDQPFTGFNADETNTNPSTTEKDSTTTAGLEERVPPEESQHSRKKLETRKKNLPVESSHVKSTEQTQKKNPSVKKPEPTPEPTPEPAKKSAEDKTGDQDSAFTRTRNFIKQRVKFGQ